MSARTRRILVFAGLLLLAGVALALLGAIYTNFGDPLFQRAFLRGMAVLGLGSVIVMSATVAGRAGAVEHMLEQPIKSHRTRRP
jgi:hypothetical protein